MIFYRVKVASGFLVASGEESAQRSIERTNEANGEKSEITTYCNKSSFIMGILLFDAAFLVRKQSEYWLHFLHFDLEAKVKSSIGLRS